MEEKRFFVSINEKILGPFDLPQLKALRDRGQLQWFHQVSEDRQTWVTASTMPELFQRTSKGPLPQGGKESSS
jgi:GYF domain 2